ncbi:MAG: pyrroline-5-carboxylate reductase [Chitinophagales bacterium]
MAAESRIAVLGGGVMGEALVSGMLAAGKVAPEAVTVTDVRAARLSELSERLGVRVTQDNRAAVGAADLVILAVKPGVVAGVLAEVRDSLVAGATVLSIAAGVPVAELEAATPPEVAVVRAMPNSPCRVREGALALVAGRGVTDAVRSRLTGLLEAVGLVFWVEESLIDVVTGLSGSGPAYVYMFLEALADGAVKVGLPRQLAQRLAAQTVLGAARLALAMGEHPAALKDQVATPGGTTIAGLAVLEEGGFRSSALKAVVAAAARSAELAAQRKEAGK